MLADPLAALPASVGPALSQTALAAGRRVGPYEVVAPLGAGGMGEVYRARDTKLHRDVALKVLPERFALDPDRSARFTREAHLLATLNHPNIAAIYGLEESNPSTGSAQAAVQALVGVRDVAESARATSLVAMWLRPLSVADVGDWNRYALLTVFESRT